MIQMLIGFVFVFLDFDITHNISKIGLLPDFIGYIFLYKGLQELAKDSPLFKKMKPYTIGMAIYTGILYFCDLKGFTLYLGGYSLILRVISFIFSLYISYKIIMGIIKIEEVNESDLNGDTLKRIWIQRTIFAVLTIMFVFIFKVYIILNVLTAALSIYFLFEFKKAKRLYDDMKYRMDWRE